MALCGELCLLSKCCSICGYRGFLVHCINRGKRLPYYCDDHRCSIRSCVPYTIPNLIVLSHCKCHRRRIQFDQYQSYALCPPCAGHRPSCFWPNDGARTMINRASQIARYKEENERARLARRKQEVALGEVMRKRQEVRACVRGPFQKLRGYRYAWRF